MTQRRGQFEVVVADTHKVSDLVRRIEFAAPDGKPLPVFSGGSHTIIDMQDGARVRRNPYSLMSDPAHTERYAISVRRDDNGRGGSLFMHNRVARDDRMWISYPVNLFPLSHVARRHIFLAGGIGITPFIAQAAEAEARALDFEFHYSFRSRDESAYADTIVAAYGKRVHLRETDRDGFLDFAAVLHRQPLGTHLYVCGPKPMLHASLEAAQALGWPPQNLHYEEFLAPKPGAPYTVRLAVSQKDVPVLGDQSMLEAIEAAGVDAPYLCRGGACGQCETKVVSCDGTLLHRDHWLSDEDKASATKVMPCVSRFEGKSLVLER